MNRIAIVLLPILLIPRAGLSADNAAKLELKLLQGDWDLIGSVREGEEIPRERLRGVIHTIRDDRWIPGRDPSDSSTMTLAPDAEPKAIDLKDREGNLLLGIYKREGETLTLCIARSGVPRPKRFVSAEGSKTYLVVLKRRLK